MSSIRFAAILVACFFLSTQLSSAAGGGNIGGPGPAQGSRRGPDLTETYREGVELLATGDCKQAEKRFRSVLKKVSSNPEANLMRGAALQCQGKHKAATRYLKKAKRYDKKLYAAYQRLGVSYLEMGKRDEAQEELDDLTELLESCGQQCPKGLSRSHSQLEAALGGATEHDVDASSDSKDDQHGLLFDPGSQPQSTYLVAVQHIHAERFTKAIEELRQLTVEIGPHPDVLTYLGYAHKRLGRFESARGYYEQALAIDGLHRGAHEYLGEMWIDLGRLDEANAHLAALDQACTFGCAEYEELKRAMESSLAAPR
jgi:tetratricopeptide (TPR) repeat protein